MKMDKKEPFAPLDSECKETPARTNTAPTDCVKETQPAYARTMRWGIPEKRQGEYTVEDYYAIPGDYRVELIDGVIYDMSAPGNTHQSITGFIFNKIFNYIMDHKGNCIPSIAPCDVQLDRDDHTMVQPDILITCDRRKITSRCIYGAPDFIVEVLSPSTRKKDMTVKLQKYRSAGVHEYWIVDPRKKQTLVYDLSSDAPPAVYGAEDKVSIGVLKHGCVIDFHDVYDYVHFANRVLGITDEDV